MKDINYCRQYEIIPEKAKINTDKTCRACGFVSGFHKEDWGRAEKHVIRELFKACGGASGAIVLSAVWTVRNAGTGTG